MRVFISFVIKITNYNAFKLQYYLSDRARDKKCDQKLFMKMTCRFNVTHPALRKG